MKNNRRDFIKKSTALAALSLTGFGGAGSRINGFADSSKILSKERTKSGSTKPEIKIALQASSEPTEDDIKFIHQMGLDQVVLWTDASKSSAEYYASRKRLYGDTGINVFGFGNRSVHNVDSIVLNLPGRDEKIEEYKNHLRNLGKAGIKYTTYAHMANIVEYYRTGSETTRGGYSTSRSFDSGKVSTGTILRDGTLYTKPLSHDRKYTEDEIWANYEYFIKAVTPVAEEADVNIGIHPDDPPVPELGGVPRCIFSSFDGYKRALEIANSPNVGMCLCTGCWLSGGTLMGKDVIDTIHYFGKRKKIFKVHFRNVSSPLPHFVETFLDDGYGDMYKILKALKEVDFDGVIIADHVPSMVNGSGTPFTIGYMKALLKLVNT